MICLRLVSAVRVKRVDGNGCDEMHVVTSQQATFTFGERGVIIASSGLSTFVPWAQVRGVEGDSSENLADVLTRVQPAPTKVAKPK